MLNNSENQTPIPVFRAHYSRIPIHRSEPELYSQSVAFKTLLKPHVKVKFMRSSVESGTTSLSLRFDAKRVIPRAHAAPCRALST